MTARNLTAERLRQLRNRVEVGLMVDAGHAHELLADLAAAESELQAAKARLREAEAILDKLAASDSNTWVVREARNHFGRHGSDGR